MQPIHKSLSPTDSKS